MTTWIIEPRDPLIVRDGRPFGPQPGARARSLGFPYPSTTTGGVRTREGLDAAGIFTAKPDVVRKIAVRGPLLVELDDQGAIATWLCPASADALLLEASDRDHVTRRRLTPLQMYSGAETDLAALRLVGLVRPDPRKPSRDAPRFWYWPVFKQWLRAPGDDAPALADLGHDGPQADSRLHVSIDPETVTHVEGALFQTSGLEFTLRRRGLDLGRSRRLALAVETDAGKIAHGLAPLAGERRIVAWRRSDALVPSCPQDIRDAITSRARCRLVLLTPAFFIQGAIPTWLCEPSNSAGVAVSLVALACSRYQIVSGWDLAVGTRGKPKPTRRLVPAGSVLFLELNADDRRQIDAWITTTWMRCISDTEQDRLDGFGLAALGTWDGSYMPMEDI